MNTLEQIAQKLKSTREAQGISLKQIYEKTKIPMAHLQGLDQNKFDDLPEPVYVVGFIKRYANYVGLNGDILAGEYKKTFDYTKYKDQDKSLPPNVPVITTDDYFKKSKIENSPPTFKTFYFNLVCILLVLGLVSYVGMTQFNNYGNQLDNTSLSSRQLLPKQDSAPQVPVVTSNATPTDGKVMLLANKHVWIEIKSAATGDNLFIGYMEQGDQKSFDGGKEGLRIRVADGGSINVSYQGKSEPFGTAGQETERVIAGTSNVSAGKEPITTTATTNTAANPLSTSNDAQHKPVTTKRITEEPVVSHRRMGESHHLDSTADTNSTAIYKYNEGRLDSE